MKQLFSSRSTSLAATSATRYLNPFAAGGFQTTESSASSPVSAPGTLRNLAVTLTAAPGVGISAIYTIAVNGTPSALTCTISSAGVSASDTTHNVTVSAGDVISLVRTTSGGSPATGITIVALEFEGSTTAQTTYGGNAGQGSNTTERYADPQMPNGGAGGTPAQMNSTFSQTNNAAALWAVAGTLTRMDITLSTSTGAGKSRTYTLYKNGVAQDGTLGTPDTRVTISNTSTSGSSTFSLSLSAGDTVILGDLPTGTPAIPFVGVGLAFTATTDGEFQFGASTDINTQNGTFYAVHPHNRIWDATESNAQAIGGPTTFYLSKFRIKTSAADNGRTVGLRRNGSAGGPTVTMNSGGTTFVDSTHAMSLASGDVWSVESIGTGLVHVNYAAVGTLGNPAAVTTSANQMLMGL